MASSSPDSEDPDTTSTDASKQKRQKHLPELAFEVDGSVVWSGKQKAFNRASFMRLSVCGKRWIVKPINRLRYVHHPLAINLVAEALHLGSTTGILQTAFFLNGRPEPMTLEAEVACLPGFERNPLGKSGIIWDVNEQSNSKTAAISLSDLCHANDCDRIDSVSTASVQRLGLLVMLTRCETVNNDDILLRPANGGLELVLGDAKKAFGMGGHARVRYWESKVFDEEERRNRPGGPLDEMRCVFDCVEMVMTHSERYDHVAWDDDFGWKNEDGEDRRAHANVWVRWEKRPLASSVVQLLLAWTPQEIAAALDSEASARRQILSQCAALETGSSGEGAASSSNALAAAANDNDNDDDDDGGADAPEPELAWKAHWKEALLELQQQVRDGRRPSLRQISDTLAKERK